jgi:hypothetical protein
MNATTIDYCAAGKNTLISRRVIVKFICIMIYLCIYIINYKRVNAYFNKKQEEKDREEVDEVLGLIRPVDEVLEDEVVEEMETLYISDFEGTGEQLRRLRAYNQKSDGETDEQYEKRIWSIADKEDAEEEEIKKVLNSVASANSVANANEIVPVANEIVEPLEKDTTVWYTIDDGKGRYKGEWRNGLPNGKGIKHIYKSDSYIDGNFVDGFSEGHGKQTFEQTWEKTVPYYEGEFKRNQWHGKGEYYYGDGDYYKGDWKDSKYHGQGAAYSKRLDRTWVGEYKNDEKVDGNWVRGEI